MTDRIATPIDDVTVRFATERDVTTIREFIHELAIYEKLEHEMVATDDILRASLFGDRPGAEVVIADRGDHGERKPVAFALFFPNFSTFLGRPGIYLEDLFVRPAHRGLGIGKTLLSFLAKIAVERNGGRLEWSVLDWNDPAIDFYRTLGASSMDGWTTFRATGPALEALARRFDSGSVSSSPS